MSIHDLEEIKLEENTIRDNLYNPEYANHLMSTDPYYNLVEITEDIWNHICVAILQIKEDTTLYFPGARLQLRKRITRSWKDVEALAKDNMIKYHFGDNADHVFIAGGRALATLLTVPYTDTDYFTTKQIEAWEIKTKSPTIEISPHVINFDEKKQLIKRLYKIPHEIVHSFDIDCCSVLINKDGVIYGSKRFIYSLINGYNTVDFEYFSPSYEWRLIKYSNRGFSVFVPYILNCAESKSLYTKIDTSVCIPDSIWSFADIDDLLDGSMLRSILMNAKGLQKILIASSVSTTDGKKSEFEAKRHRSGKVQSSRRLSNLSSKQVSDYEDPVESTDAISGKININSKFYYLDGVIGYDDQHVPNSYKGVFMEPNDGYQKAREFSPDLTSKLLNIFISPYRNVKPGEQTTSTFHKIILENPDEWYQLDKSELFENSLYTLLYFRSVSRPPSLYDEKVKWFGPQTINLFVYHFARLLFNNRIYSKFNNFEITDVRITYGDIRPKSIIYNREEFIIPGRDTKGIFNTLLLIGSKYNIFNKRELDLLNSLSIRTKEGVIPKIESR